MIIKNKKAIQDHSVFDGLCVSDKDHYASLYLRPDFYLWEAEKDGQKAHVVFQVDRGAFVFHLVNFTRWKTRDMTRDFMRDFVMPFCHLRGLRAVFANVERRGMAIKLERFGFKNVGGNRYMMEVAHVL